MSVENPTLTTDTAAPYHHAQQLNKLTTAVTTENRREIFSHEELNTIARTSRRRTTPSSTTTRWTCTTEPCRVQGHCAVPAQGPNVPGYPGGHEHQELPGQGPQLSQQQGRIQAGSHSENQKTSYSWAVNKGCNSHLFIFHFHFYTINKFPFRIHKPPWSQSSERSSLTDEIQRMKHVSN